MKKFLIVMNILLLIALLSAVGVFWYLHSVLNTTPVQSIPADTKESVTTTPAVTAQEAVSAPPEGVKVDASQLSNSQAEMLETVGVDTDNLTITPAMIQCAEDVLGPDRVAEIAAGDSPTFFETGRLLPCVGAE